MLKALSEHIHNNKLIERLTDSYNRYQKYKNAGYIKIRDGFKERISIIETKINNLVDVIVNTGSEALAKKLSELEVEKIYLEADYNKICKVYNIQEITQDKLKKTFQIAKYLLETRELPGLRKLIENYVDKVIVYSDYADVLFRFHPELKYNEPDDRSGRGLLRLTSTTICLKTQCFQALQDQKTTKNDNKLSIQVVFFFM